MSGGGTNVRGREHCQRNTLSLLFSEIGFCVASCSYICDHPWEKGVWVNFGQYEIIASVPSSGLNASIYVD